MVCIPAFNEERNISRVIRLAQKYADKVLVCDDGSSDSTRKIAQHHGADVIHHENNQGYGASIRHLFEKSKVLRADIIVTLDADGQHNPKYIPAIISPIRNEYADIVIGSRFLDEESENSVPFIRHKGIKLITCLARAISYNHITDAQSGFRAYNKKALNLLNPKENGWGASTELLTEAKKYGFTLVEIPVNINYDNANKRNLILHGVGVIVSTIKQYFINRSFKL